ncbi:c-type cytochrome [Paracoccus aminophilus]|uniref:Gluconate 2-dehydrogenase (Acceptor) n=1 Tax=Paracoccus aminophilus JCM 7686 TaxID=1367847 RepID=S5XXY9_PARAH|nr:cytochrome c [Paracoccus aminophilus]AGT08315.1 gluconate 2-dehydrogenase (acceptor) [Paracoccus aminophilus JCM 7686]
MLKRTIYGLLALGVVAVIGFAIYAYRPALPEISAEARPQFDAATIETGRVLAAAGYCETCHTAPGGAPYAGNYALNTNFGTIYASNITPDPKTGIGSWSPEAFRRAMQEGVSRDGAHLFPAFPYDHFTKMSDADIDAIYGYLMAKVAPVSQETKPATIAFPLNQRVLQAGWQLLFVDFGRYKPDPSKSEAWNRGAYLVEGVTHCGACHTPRNQLGAERKSEAFAGAPIDGWTAPALTRDNPSAVPWTAADFTQYLQTGAGTYHGVAAGPMSPVVHAGVAQLPKSDLEAIGIYLGDIVGAPQSDPAQNAVVVSSLAASRPDPSYRKDEGERLYVAACAACHYNSDKVLAMRPLLGINSSVRLSDPSNLIRVMLKGISVKEGSGGVVMPSYGQVYSDAQIAAIANYLRKDLAGLEPWPDLALSVAQIRGGETAPVATARASTP